MRRFRGRRRHFVLNFFACFLIPVYTISFAGSTEWFGSNFSVIAVTGRDHYRGFLYWGLLAGSYFFMVVNRLAFSLSGQLARLTVSWLVLPACLALGYSLAIPYLPDYFPRFAALHVGLAAGACALLMLALLVVLLILCRQRPDRYGRLLLAWGLIVLGSAVLFLIPRMVSSALEVFFTISAALLARKLYMLRQGEL